MPEGRRPSPGACEKPRAGTFAVARGKRRSAGRGPANGGRGKSVGNLFAVARGSAGRRGAGLRWANAARARTSRFRSRGEAQVGEGEGPANGGRGKRVGKPFSVARGSAGRRGWVRMADAAMAVFGRASQVARVRARARFSVASGKRRSAGERGLRMADAARVRMSRSRSRPGSVTAIGIVGKTGSANAGKGMRGGQGKPLPGSGLCGGRGWGKNAWAGALRLRDRKNRAREGCPPAAPHI